MTPQLSLLQADDYFNPRRVGELFSENLQNRNHVQTSQFIMYKN